MKTEKVGRLAAANRVIEVIASCGRKFFACDGTVAKFELSPDGKLWWIDDNRGSRVYVRERSRMRGFTGGGTLRALMLALAEFVRKGSPVPPCHFGPWPQSCCNGDLWGYGPDMQQVRDAAESLGVTAPKAEAAA